MKATYMNPSCSEYQVMEHFDIKMILTGKLLCQHKKKVIQKNISCSDVF